MMRRSSSSHLVAQYDRNGIGYYQLDIRQIVLTLAIDRLRYGALSQSNTLHDINEYMQP